MLGRFTGFGTSELATSRFPMAKEAFRSAWGALGEDLGAITSKEGG